MNRPGDVTVRGDVRTFAALASGRHYGGSWHTPNGAAQAMREAALRFRVIVARAVGPRPPA
ncbi:MAG TPA: hypothetical protein VKG38_06485 [Solirubrobacteraceae bacterium]|nr:hypothetical protein [Solirubrobacteraceae bacterium]